MKWFFCVLGCCFLLAVMLPIAQCEEMTYDYTYLGENVYQLGNTGYLIDFYDNFIAEKYWQNLYSNAADLNRLVPLHGKVKKYIYFVESSRSTDLRKDLSGESEVYRQIREHFEADGIGTLALESQADFLNWFYQTDHHWNYKGSYQGYLDIVSMIFGEDEPVAVPAKVRTFKDLYFNGSYCKRIGQQLSTEQFAVYRFNDLPEYTARLNGKRAGTYGRTEMYYTGKYPRKPLTNHYGLFYGGDYGEVIISTNQRKKPNILLLSNSYDNAILLLLSRHFNSIYSIDLRHYEQQFGIAFDLQQYIDDHDIDILLMMGDAHLFYHHYQMQPTGAE